MKVQGGQHTGSTQRHALRPCIHCCLAHALYMKAMYLPRLPRCRRAGRERPVSMLKSSAKQIVFWAPGTKGCRWIWSFKND